jgi:hypothetical protein
LGALTGRFSNFLGWHITKAVHLAKAAGWQFR